MITQIKSPISVISFYNSKKGTSNPKVIYWGKKKYKVTKVGYHHKYLEGKNLIHIYSVLADQTFFKLKCETQNLSWKLEEISDEQAE